jgi:pimeloyl-ACP methyl ester carboxylesterase
MTETIFMIHGMWGGPWCWENYKPYFEGLGYRCVTATLRLHNVRPTDPPDPRLGTTSLLDYAADLEQEIRQLGVKPIVMGHSMGGLLAQIVGSRVDPKALILLTPGAPAGILALTPSVLRSFLSGMSRWGFWKKPMRQTYGEAVYSMMHLMPPDEQRRTYDRFVYESGRAASENGFWLFDARRAAAVDESKVTCPVLVVAGAQDRITPASVVRQVARKYGAGSTYKEFPNHAHSVLSEPGWQEVAQCAADWLKQTVSG